MKHHYKTENRWKRITQTILDFFVDVYVKLFLKIENPKIEETPRKILFIVLAQLGDALVMSYVFPFIKKRFPDCTIDVLCGEWSKQILEHNPYINKLIFFNHIRMNRSAETIWTKVQNHFRTSRSALNSIRGQYYDLSIEGGVTHPNGNVISFRGKVKRRIGFGSGGFGSLLTDEVTLPNQENFHIMEAVLSELKLLEIEKSLEDINPYFNPDEKIDTQILFENNKLNPKKPFLIIHPESGNNKRMLSSIFWEEIIRTVLKSSNYYVIICGIYNSTSIFVEYLFNKNLGSEGRIISKVQKLSLDEFFLLSCNAVAAITVESLAAHLCSINCRTLSFYKNGYGRYFFPISRNQSTVVHNHSPSREADVFPNCDSIFIENFESETIYNITEDFIKSLNK
jgi:heptosyltransferase III